MLNQPFLAPQPATIPRQTAIRTEHPMAGNDNRNLVGAIGAGHRPHGGRPLHGGCERGIADDLTRRDFPQVPPDIALKGRAVAGEPGFETVRTAGEIGRKFRGDLAGDRGAAQHHIRAGARPQPFQLGWKGWTVGEFEEMQGVIVGDSQHRADRRIDPVALEEPLPFMAAGEVPKNWLMAERKPLPDS